MSNSYDKAIREAMLRTTLDKPSYDRICEWISWIYGPKQITGESITQYTIRMSLYGEGIGAYGDEEEQSNNRIAIGC